MQTDKYLGLPYKLGGREETGLDCWGLARLIYKNEFNIELPSYSDHHYNLTQAEKIEELINQYKENWQQIDYPEEGAVVLFRVMGSEAHIGVCLNSSSFIHVRENSDSVIENFSNIKWANRIVGYFKYVDNVKATILPHPLKTQKLIAEIVPGTTLLEVVENAYANLTLDDKVAQVSKILVNGFSVLPEKWSDFVLQKGDLVEIRALPKGRNFLRLILVIALIYITVQTGAPQALGNALTPAGTSAATAKFVGTVVINTVGQAIINAIAPPISDSQDQSNDRAGKEQLILTGGSNELKRYGTIPVVLGKVRLTPPLGAQTYLSFPNETDAYIKMVLAWGFGPLNIDYNTIRVGNKAFNTLSDTIIVTHDRITEPSAALVRNFKDIYSNDVQQDYKNQQLEYPGHSAPFLKFTGLTPDKLIFSTNLSGVTAPSSHVISCTAENFIPTSYTWQYSPDEVTWTTFSTGQAQVTVPSSLQDNWIRITTTGTTTYGQSVNLSRKVYIHGLVEFEQQYQRSWIPSTEYINKLKIVCTNPEVFYKATNSGFQNIYLDNDQEVRFRLYWGTTLLTPNSKRNYYVGENPEIDGMLLTEGTKVLIEDNDVVIPRPDVISQDPATVTLKFTVQKLYTYETEEYSNQEVAVAQPFNFVINYKPSRSSLSTDIDSESGWYVTGFNNPAERVEIAIQYPEGIRRVITEGSRAGTSATQKVKVEGRIRYSGQTTWTPIFSVTEEGILKDGFTKTYSHELTDNTLNFEIGVRRATTSDPQTLKGNQSYFRTILQTVTSFRTVGELIVDPSADAKIAKSAISIRATNQLSGQVEGISAEVTTICRIYTGTNTEIVSSDLDTYWGTYAPTSNPAALFLYVLTHPANPRRILESEIYSKINIKQLQYWYKYCADPVNYRNITLGLRPTEPGEVAEPEQLSDYIFEYNDVIANQISILEILRSICAAGRASPSLVDGKWTVIIDEPKSVVQHFTPHNSWDFESVKALPRLPDAIKAKFFNQEKNYQQDERIIYNIGKNKNTPNLLFEEMNLTGITNSHQVYDHVKWHFAQAKLRSEIYSLNTDIEYLVCNRGDRVKVTHDVPMWGSESGRIKLRLPDNTQLSTPIYKLTDPVPYEQGKNYNFRIRSKSGISTTVGLKTTFLVSSYLRAGNVVRLFLNNNGLNPLKPNDIVDVSTNIPSINGSSIVIQNSSSSYIEYANIGTYTPAQEITGQINLSTGYYDTVEFTNSFTTTDCDVDDLFLFGELGKESQDLIVLSVEPADGNKTAKLTLMDYGVSTTTGLEYNIFTDYRNLTEDTVFNSLITDLPLLQTNSLADKYPNLDSTKLISDDGAIELLGPGTYNYGIIVPYTNDKIDGSPLNLPYTAQYVELQAELLGSSSTIYTKIESISKGSIKVLGVEPGKVYRIRLRYVLQDGTAGTWSPWIQHTVVGRVPPSNVDGLFIETVDSGIDFNWIANEDIDYAYTIIKEGSSWENGNIIFNGKANNFTWVNPPSGTYTFFIKHFDTLGSESLIPRIRTVDYSQIELNITIELTNQTHTVSANSNNIATTLLNSGTNVYVYQGNKPLQYDELGTSTGTWKIVTPLEVENVTPGVISVYQDSNLFVDIAQVSDLTAFEDLASAGSITYTIQGVTLNGEQFTRQIIQRFNKVKSGENPVIYSLSTITPVIYKSSPDTSIPGQFTTLSVQGTRKEGNLPEELYGFIGVTPYLDGVEGTEEYHYQTFEYTPPDTSTVTRYRIRLYDQDSEVPPNRLSTILDEESVLVIFEGEVYNVEIQSTNGTTFRPGQGSSTILAALVFKNGVDITQTLSSSVFRWRRVSGIPQPAPNDDDTWNNTYLTGYKQISVNVDDVYARATFFCDIII